MLAYTNPSPFIAKLPQLSFAVYSNEVIIKQVITQKEEIS